VVEGGDLLDLIPAFLHQLEEQRAKEVVVEAVAVLELLIGLMNFILQITPQFP
jgi:hypothetical protein